MTNLPTKQAPAHAFNPIFAAHYGVNEAIVIAHLQFWVNHNQALGRNKKEGRTWTYQTRREIAAWFPYFSKDQVRRITDSLEKQGVLIKGNFNKQNIDKTIWYAFENEEIFTTGKIANSTGKSANPSGTSATPIPDTKTTDPKHQIERAKNKKKDKKKKIAPEVCSSSKKEERGAKRPKGYLTLSSEQKEAYNEIMSLEAMSPSDEGIKPSAALNWLTKCLMTPARAKQLCNIYRRDCERYADRGAYIENMAGYITKAFQTNRAVQSPNFEANKKWWDDRKVQLHSMMYKESEKYIYFPYIDNEVGFNMAPDIFIQTLCEYVDRNSKEYKSKEAARDEG